MFRENEIQPRHDCYSHGSTDFEKTVSELLHPRTFFDVQNFKLRTHPVALPAQNFEGPKCLILGGHQYFVRDATSQSTK